MINCRAHVVQKGCPLISSLPPRRRSITKSAAELQQCREAVSSSQTSSFDTGPRRLQASTLGTSPSPFYANGLCRHQLSQPNPIRRVLFRMVCRRVLSGSKRTLYAHVAGKAVYDGKLPPGHVDRLTSVSNPYVKHCDKLRKSASYRREEGSLLLVGRTLIGEVIESCGSLEARALVLRDDADDNLDGLHAERVLRVTEPVIRKMAGLKNADNLDMLVELPLPPPIDQTIKRSRVLALDGVQDPGNLGTLVRSALAFGFEAVAVLPSSCDPFNDKAVRAARGASFRIPVHSMTWEALESMAHAQDLSLLAADPHADPAALDPFIARAPSPPSAEEGEVPSTTTPEPSPGVCLVLGSEGQGLSDQALKACTPVAIPMPGKMESLNVAIAGGILMYLMRRTA